MESGEWSAGRSKKCDGAIEYFIAPGSESVDGRHNRNVRTDADEVMTRTVVLRHLHAGEGHDESARDVE